MEVFYDVYIHLDSQSIDSIFDDFYNAIKQRNYEGLERLLKDSNFTITKRLVYTPLHLAAELGDSKAVALLLQHGKCLTKAIYCFKNWKCNWQKLTPLLLAVKSGCIDVVEQLIDFGFQVDEDITIRNDGWFTCLQSTIFMDNIQMVKTFLRRGADINKFYSVDRSPLYIAIKNKNPDMVGFLLQQGATFANNNDLMRAILNFSDEKILEILLEHGQLMDVKNEEGKNLLWVAVKYNNNKLLRVMVERCLDPSQVINESSLLHAAMKYKNSVSMNFLLKYNIDVNAYDTDGHTAMHLLFDTLPTRTWKKFSILQKLLLLGADPDVIEKNKKFTPLDSAVFQQHLWKNERFSDHVDLDNCIELLLTAKTDYSDILDKHERREYKDVEMKKLFTKYFIKREICGLSVDERVRELFETPRKPSFQDNCIKELKKLRNIKISENFSLYDVLHVEYKGDLLELVELKKFHEVFRSMINKFPLYKNILLWRFISAKRLQFIGIVRKSFYTLCQASLPTLVIDRIVEHLSDVGKRRVIEAVTCNN